MIQTFFATKKSMTQAWDKQGRRVAITKLIVEPNLVVGERMTQVKTDKTLASSWKEQKILEIGYGQKKLKNQTKPLRSRLQKLNFTTGVRQIVGVRVDGNDTLSPGQALPVEQILKVGSLVKVRGTTKGRGFAGAVKRYGFAGGPKTHGQSDRLRAVGSIGNRTTPGRVWLGKRMPGHYGDEKQTVSGLVIAHFDQDKQELWVTGTIPGAFNSLVQITLTGKNKKNFALNLSSSQNEEKAEEEKGEKEIAVETKTEPSEKTKTEVSAESQDQVKTEEKKETQEEKEA